MISLFHDFGKAESNGKNSLNRKFRLNSSPAYDNLIDLLDKSNESAENGDFDKVIELLERKRHLELEIVYDDIRNGLILPEEEIVEFIDHYLNEMDIVKLKMLSYILNTYYSNEFLVEKIEETINNEEYELSAVIKELLEIKVIPINKG